MYYIFYVQIYHEMPQSDGTILVERVRARKCLLYPLLTRKSATMTPSAHIHRYRPITSLDFFGPGCDV